MKHKDLTFYEIVRTGFPCRLNFDIEYDKLLNPTEDGEVSMTIFRNFLIEYVQETLNLKISPLIVENDKN